MARFRQAPSPALAALTLQTDNALVASSPVNTPPYNYGGPAVVLKSLTIKGNALGTNGMLVVDGAVQGFNTTFKISLGSATVASIPSVTVSSISFYTFFRLFVFNRNSAKSQNMVAETYTEDVTTRVGPKSTPALATSTTTVDMTVDQILQMQATPTASGLLRPSYTVPWWGVRLVRP